MFKHPEKQQKKFRYGLLLLVLGLSMSRFAVSAVPGMEEMWQVIQQQQRTIETLQARLDAAQQQPSVSQQPGNANAGRLEKRVAENEARLEATAAIIEQQGTGSGTGWWNRTAVGGYGSARFEASGLDKQNTGFTHRRFVLALNSQLLDRLQVYFELEFERFTNLELEKGVAAGGDEFEFSQAIEGTNGSEISVEQAWARYTINSALQVDFGGVLVPIGRFNIRHDDNQ